MKYSRLLGAGCVLAMLAGGCLPPAGHEAVAPAVVAQTQLPPIRVEAPGIKVDGKDAVAPCPVVLRVVARKYSSGSIYYEVKDVVPQRTGGFAILVGRTESVAAKDPPAPDASATRIHEAQRRTVVEYDLVQLHVTLEIERTDAAGKEHPPTLVASCRTELWGTERVFVGERSLRDNPARWGELVERLESTKRVEAPSDGLIEVVVDAGTEWLPSEKVEVRPPHPMRRGVGHRTVIMRRGTDAKSR